MPKKKPHSDWDYAPAPESTAQVNLAKRYDHFIGGKWTPPAKKKYFTSINPATGKKIAEVAEGTKADVNAAVKAARAAYDGTWGKMSGRERGKYIYRIARLIQERAREFAIRANFPTL